MTKIAYNGCYGGFELSNLAFQALLDRKGIAWEREEGNSQEAHKAFLDWLEKRPSLRTRFEGGLKSEKALFMQLVAKRENK